MTTMSTARLDSLISGEGSLQPWGDLPPVPEYDRLEETINDISGREAMKKISGSIDSLGRAVQLGNHRQWIERLDSELDRLGMDALLSISRSAQSDVNLCTVLSVYLTCLEQTYHWPGEVVFTTPKTLNQYKMVVQVFHEPELHMMLAAEDESQSPDEKTLTALAMANRMFDKASAAKADGTWPLPRPEQDKVNLLNRTARGDIWDQGAYDSRGCHREMSRLHDMVRTNGTQRRCQEIFEDAGGIEQLQRMPGLLKRLDCQPAVSIAICEALGHLQVAVACAREELFSMVVDEVIWGHTFAKWSKAFGVSDIGSSGSDCPLFWMLDGLIGRADSDGQATLPDSLAFRSRFFPPDVTALVKALATAPSLRAHAAKNDTSYALVQAWKGFVHILHDLYDIHRKKAMRIVLSLRAGKGKTSSGLQKAVAPELQLSENLYQALAVRFGNDNRDLAIDAFAWSSPLLLGPRGKVESARVRFVFATPMVVSLGDTVCVNVKLPGVGWQERMYSIVHIDPLAGTTIGPCQLATSVEVCARSHGSVSKYICTRTSGFSVRLRIKAAPHFRVQDNKTANDERIMIAQGGGLGGFLGWLLQQETLVGKYRLVIGVRDYGMLPYASLLNQLATTFGPALRIVVAMSSPGIGDVQSLLSSGIKPYVGRVTGYLGVCSLLSQKGTTWYVCGSAAFGLDAARCIEARSKLATPHGNLRHQSDPRLAAITTSSLPNVRLHVAGSSTCSPESGLSCSRQISKTELALHNRPQDRWIALGDRVYDISDLATFHPGGEKVLTHCGGRDAQGMLDTVHRDSFMVVSVLNEMFIGKLAPSLNAKWETIMDHLVEIQNDLEVQSRFEQTPTGCPEQLERAPPVEVIRSSITGLVRNWTEKILEKHTSSDCAPEGFEELYVQLHTSTKESREKLDTMLSGAYTEHFHDLKKCAEALKRMHICHYRTISKIHQTIDDLKNRIHICVAILSMSPELALLVKSSKIIIDAISQMLGDCAIQE